MVPYISLITAGALQSRATPCGILKFELDPVAVDVSALYIQIIDSATAPATGTVPKKSWPAAQALYKEFKSGELELSKGCFIGLSTTEATYTNSATSGTYVQLEFTQPTLPSGLSSTGDLTTGRKSLKPWNQSQGPQFLYFVEIDASGGDAEAIWLLIFTNNNPATPDKTCYPAIPLGINQVHTIANGNPLTFGTAGFSPAGYTSLNNDFTTPPTTGCSLMLSTTPTFLTPPANATVTIKAWYKTT